MARVTGRLTARAVATATPAKGRDWETFADGDNLILVVSRGAQGRINKSWMFKYQLDFRRHEMGLGGYPLVSLKEAREEAQELRKKLLKKIDPLEERQQEHRAKLAERAKQVTFAECVEM
jgi:hypothetical protein